MSKTNGLSLEKLAADAGVDVEAALVSLGELDEKFGGEAGLISDGALMAWTHEFFSQEKLRQMAFLLAKKWEQEIELPEDRKWERHPDAAKIKAKKNLEKAAAKK